MSALEFISKFIEATAWPISIVILGLVLRNPIKSLIMLLSKVKYKDFEFQFGKDMSDLSQRVSKELGEVKNESGTDSLRAKMMEILPLSPKKVIKDVWNAVEESVLGISPKEMRTDTNLVKKPIKLAEALLKRQIIDETQYSIIEEMRLLRNKVVHYEKEQITIDNALEYLDSGIKLISSLKAKQPKHKLETAEI